MKILQPSKPIHIVREPMPEAGIIDVRWLAKLELFCEQRGNIFELAADHFEMVLAMGAHEMRSMIHWTLRASWETIGTICDDPDSDDDEIFRSLQGSLYLVFRGNFTFADDGRYCIRKPTGPTLTREIQRRLIARLRNDRPVQEEVFDEVLEELASWPPS